MTFRKTLGPNGTISTMVSSTTGSWQGWVPDKWLIGFGHHCSRRWSPKGVFLKIQKIVKGTQNQFITKVRHRDPLKNVPGNGLGKAWKLNDKTIGNSMVFDGPKALKSIEKQIHFLIFGHSSKIWKNDAKGDLESHDFWTKMTTWASQVRLILWFWTFWCDAPKWWFLDALPLVQQIIIFGVIFVSGRVCREIENIFGKWGPHPFRAREAQRKDTRKEEGSNTPEARGLANLYGYE